MQNVRTRRHDLDSVRFIFDLDRGFAFLEVCALIATSSGLAYLLGRKHGIARGMVRGDRAARKRFRARADSAVREVQRQINSDAQFHELIDTDPGILAHALASPAAVPKDTFARPPRPTSTQFLAPDDHEIMLEPSPVPGSGEEAHADAFREISQMIEAELEPIDVRDLRTGDRVEYKTTTGWELGKVGTLATRAHDGSRIVAVKGWDGHTRCLPLWEIRKPKP